VRNLIPYSRNCEPETSAGGSRKITKCRNKDRNAGDVECAAGKDGRHYYWSNWQHIQQFYDIHIK
jgi:hypothetical protein